MFKTVLLVIDPQNDFCQPSGSLFVPGADEDSKRLADMIDRVGDRLYDIHVTLDTHHVYDIAHPAFWQDPDENAPEPFTLISSKDIRDGNWKPVDQRAEMLQYVAAYTEELERNGRYILCVWPPHCLIGTPGHNVVKPVREALRKWEEQNVAMVNYVTKGSNFRTEHYSAIQADVPDSADPSTMINTTLLEMYAEADCVALTGQALSHCVANTVRDIADNFGEKNIQKLMLIEDTTSSVPGFEDLGRSFVQEMVARGMKLTTAEAFME